MPSDVAAFARESTRPDGSPAQAVLQDFIVRGLSVDHLFLMLCDMGHVEGMKTIQQYGEYVSGVEGCMSACVCACVHACVRACACIHVHVHVPAYVSY